MNGHRPCYEMHIAWVQLQSMNTIYNGDIGTGTMVWVWVWVQFGHDHQFVQLDNAFGTTPEGRCKGTGQTYNGSSVMGTGRGSFDGSASSTGMVLGTQDGSSGTGTVLICSGKRSVGMEYFFGNGPRPARPLMLMTAMPSQVLIRRRTCLLPQKMGL